MTLLKSKSPFFLLNKNTNVAKNETESKMENPTHSFREMNHVFQLVEELQIKSKTVMSWSLRKKECIFCNVYFVHKKIFKHLCFILVYSILNKLLEYTYFNISKTLLHALLLLAFRIVEGLQCIPNYKLRHP